MKKKFLGRVLTMLLVASMVFTLLPASAIAAGNWWWNADEYTEEAAPAATADNSSFMRIFHLDCGRKYFTKDEILNIIDTAANCGYTHVELAFGNDGLRFLLNDMSLTANGKDYSSEDVRAAIQYGNTEYNTLTAYSQSINELTEDEMLEILTHASGMGIGIIPMFDAPGHMYALIKGMSGKLGLTARYRHATTSGNNSRNWALILTDTYNEDSVAFVKALMQKYIQFFADNGAKYFNIAADECGFVSAMSGTPINDTNGEYTAFASFVNEMNRYVKSCGMTTMAFNDGFYHKNMQIAENSFDTDILICYWDASANSYAQAAELAQKGFSIINTNNRWYYVIGKEQSSGSNWSQYAYHLDYAIKCMGNEDCLTIDGDGKKTVPVGCMTAVWCDNPSATYLKTSVESYMAAMKSSNPDYFTAATSPVEPEFKIESTGTPTMTIGQTATLSVGTEATWECDNDAVVAITPLTRSVMAAAVSVEAIGEGNATITATTADGSKTASYNVEVVDNTPTQTIRLTIGKQQTVPVNGHNYENNVDRSKLNENIATVTVTGQDSKPASTTYEVENVAIGTIATTRNTWTKVENRYCKVGENYYPAYAKYEKRIFFAKYYYYGYLETDSSNKVTEIDNTTDSSKMVTLYVKKTNPATPASTTITFTGVAKGTTYVTIGGTKYTINVIPEDLSSAPKLPIQLWITSQMIEVDQNGMTSVQTSGTFGLRKAQYLDISATDELNTPVGLPLSACVPELIEQHYENDGTWWTTEQTGKLPFNFALWKGAVLTGTNLQKVWGPSCINKGTDFTYVRYYDSHWAVSSTPNDANSWKNVTGEGSRISSSSCKEQLVAYYYMQTKLTDDVTTNIVDWGEPYESYQNVNSAGSDSGYVLLDFAVKTETGEAIPAISDFPMKGRTLAYHCNGEEATCGKDASKNLYRRIDQIEARNTSEHEIYMITLTPTNDTPTTKLATTCKDNPEKRDIYKGTEKVVWVKDAATLEKTAFADESLWYTSPSGYTQFHLGDDPTEQYVGGKAELSNVEIYNKQGLLVTYYVRSTATHKVTVHYIDQTANQPFHTAEISVKTADTYFNPNFGLSASGELINNTVNGVNHLETVQSDLKQLPLVPAQYRRANYKLVAANLGENQNAATDAYLYYTFDNTESFVVDFGLPLTIEPKDVGNLENATITNTKIGYNGGLAHITATESGTITYKLEKPLGKTPDSFTVTYTGPGIDGSAETKENVDVTFTIYILPASNVLYEASFLTQVSEDNGPAWTAPTTTPRTQQTQKVGDTTTNYAVFGRDKAYDEAYGALGAWTASGLKAGNGMTKALTTNFYGNGFDLIGKCGPKTGSVVALIKNTETNKGKFIDVDTRYQNGDIYQVPLLHVTLAEGPYTVTIYGGGLEATNETPASYSLRGAATYASDYSVDSHNADLYSILAENGLTMADVEYVKVDSAPAAAKTARRATSFYALETAAETGPVTHEAGDHVEIDGFRVYRSTNNTNNTNYPEGEKNVQYLNILDAVSSFTAFVEGSGSDIGWTARKDYENAGGPQNEIYLRKTNGENSAIAFKIDPNAIVQISARAVENGKLAKLVVNGTETVIATNTEMYYTVKANERGIVTIKNTGEGMLALGNLKIKNGTQAAALSEEDYPAAIALLSLNAAPETPDTVFEPTISAKVTTTKFIRSKVVTLTVSASADVAKLTVNGKELRPTNGWLVSMGWSKSYNYILTETVKKSETKTYEIIGYSADGTASTPTVVKSK